MRKKIDAEYSKDGKILVKCPQKLKGKFSIPAGVEVIADNAFKGCENITAITIPNTVTSIGSGAFLDCKNITSICFEKPCRVSYIGHMAFYMCEKLEEIVVPEYVTEIGASTFYNCTHLERIFLPEGLEKIGDAAFWCCSNLSKIFLPSNLKKIESGAFAYCASLKEIIIPDGVEDLHEQVFEGCVNLSKVLLGVNSHLKHIHSRAFYNCERLISINIPDEVKRIDRSAFLNCDSLRSLFIPTSVEVLENEIAAMSNMSFTFFCEGEPSNSWAPGWNCMGKYIADAKASPVANTMFHVPRWWYLKFGLPQSTPESLLRTSSAIKDFDKEKVKALINSTDKTLFFRTGWGWRGEERQEITKESAIRWIDNAAANPSDKSYIIDVFEYETEILLNLFDRSLPF